MSSVFKERVKLYQTYKTAIIGGGASGLLCAVELTRGQNPLNGNEVAILEKCDRVGKKLIATGNGQGNLTNSLLKSQNYYGDKKFIDVFLSQAENINIEEYFYSLGIPLITVGGKKYPMSRQANSVLDTLRYYLDNAGVNTFTNFEVQNIKKENGLYKLIADGRSIYAERVVIAVGGACGKQFGTDGTAYGLAEDLGHKKTAIYPSLVQIKTETQTIRSLKGLKEQATVTAYDGQKPLKTATGEVLFTDFGLSGNAIFQISGHFSKCKNPIVKIEFLPELNMEQTEKIIADRIINAPDVPFDELLSGILVKRVGQTVLKTAKTRTPKCIAAAIKNFTLKVTGTLGFNYAQVTKGGIETKNVNPKTYESTLANGIYLTGEVLDIDGDCGGYNLTFAFTSGITSAKAIKNSFNV